MNLITKETLMDLLKNLQKKRDWACFCQLNYTFNSYSHDIRKQ